MSDDIDPPPTLSFAAANIASKTKAYRRDNGYAVTTGRNPAVKLTGEGAACTHRGGVLSIDAADRTVFCDVCGAQLLAFDALVLLSQAEARMQHQYDVIVKEREQHRNFYEQKRTVTAMRCKHTHYMMLSNGSRKCYRCDTTIPATTTESTHE